MHCAKLHKKAGHGIDFRSTLDEWEHFGNTFNELWNKHLKGGTLWLGILWMNFLLVYFICFHLQWDNEWRQPNCAAKPKMWFDKLTLTSFWWVTLMVRCPSLHCRGVPEFITWNTCLWGSKSLSPCTCWRIDMHASFCAQELDHVWAETLGGKVLKC